MHMSLLLNRELLVMWQPFKLGTGIQQVPPCLASDTAIIEGSCQRRDCMRCPLERRGIDVTLLNRGSRLRCLSTQIKKF